MDKKDFQMIDVRKEYEQDLLDAQIIWEQQEQERYRAYLEEQEQLRQEMLRQQEQQQLILEENARQYNMQMPSEQMNEMVSQLSESLSLTAADMENVNGVLDRLPLFTFVFQWAYCYLYGAVLASILSRYIFMKELFNQ